MENSVEQIDAEGQDIPTTSGLGIRSSWGIGKLAGALAKAQGNFGKAVKGSANPFFKSKYADLDSVVEATKYALSENGLAVVQSPRSGIVDGQRCVIIVTLLAHSSGEWISDDFVIPVADKFTAQTVGSAVTYGRRYALQAFLGIAPADDDGNAASANRSVNLDAEDAMPNNVLTERLEWLQNAKDADELKKLFQDAWKLFQSNPEAIKALVAAKNARKKELEGQS